MFLAIGLVGKEVVIGFEIANERMDLSEGEALLLGQVRGILKQVAEIF